MVRAFLQALGVSKNPDMLLMVWRILQGLSIREVVMKYREQEAFNLTVTLARPGEQQDELETYRTDDFNAPRSSAIRDHDRGRTTVV